MSVLKLKNVVQTLKSFDQNEEVHDFYICIGDQCLSLREDSKIASREMKEIVNDDTKTFKRKDFD